jgi:hypothetical protein
MGHRRFTRGVSGSALTVETEQPKLRTHLLGTLQADNRGEAIGQARRRGLASLYEPDGAD